MATEQLKPETAAPAEPAPAPAKVEAPVVTEKPIEESKALAVAEIPAAKKASKNSLDRDIALADLTKEKNLSFIKAWEESEKSKVENKAQKQISAIATWENTRKATIEAKLKQKEEELEKKKADYAEKLQNKIALIHKQAEEKRAMVEAQKGEENLKAEELAAKYRATGAIPKKFLGCFGG